jgi:hypothetical protein
MRVFFFGAFMSIYLMGFSQISTTLDSAFNVHKGKTIKSYLHQSIDLKLPESKGIFNKEQASIILNDFFRKEAIIKYTIKHEGGGNGKSFFQIGRIKTATHQYRSYLLYNIYKEKPQIIELRIELEE